MQEFLQLRPHGVFHPWRAVADVQANSATIWSASQAVYPLRSSAAMVLGLRAQDVHVIFKMGSGCYGCNAADTVSYDAALMSQVVGRPVRVQLSRKDEMISENYGYAFVLDEKAGVGTDGIVLAWDHEAWSPVYGNRPGANQPGNVITGLLAGFEPTPRRCTASQSSLRPFGSRVFRFPGRILRVTASAYANGTSPSRVWVVYRWADLAWQGWRPKCRESLRNH